MPAPPHPQELVPLHGSQLGTCQIRGHYGGSDAYATDQNIKPSNCVDPLADGATDSVRLGTVGLNGKPAPAFFNSLNHRYSPVCGALTAERDIRAIVPAKFVYLAEISGNQRRPGALCQVGLFHSYSGSFYGK
jgi:hypothetical protein